MGSRSARGVASVQRAANLSEDKAPELPKIYTRKHVRAGGPESPLRSYHFSSVVHL